jgi:DNA-binding NtrC family response regulator
MKRILLVDDDDQTRRAVQKMLEREGYEVRSTGDGHEALELYETDLCDLLITDMIMPETDGLEMIQQILRKHPAARILAMSGGGQVGAVEYLTVAKKFGAIGVLSKPFTIEELHRAVGAAFDAPAA